MNVKLAEKNKHATHSVQRCLEMYKNKQKPSVLKDFQQDFRAFPKNSNKIFSDAVKSTSDVVLGKMLPVQAFRATGKLERMFLLKQTRVSRKDNFTG